MMTEFHTGNDIRLDTSDTHKYGEILLHSEKGAICTVHPIDENEDMPNFPLSHLIAAAPDLYEALSVLVDTLSDKLSDISAAFGEAREITAARAALAKARGE